MYNIGPPDGILPRCFKFIRLSYITSQSLTDKFSNNDVIGALYFCAGGANQCETLICLLQVH